MSRFTSLIRGLTAVAMVFAGSASAQAPANDTCTGAVTLSPITPNVPVVSPGVSVLNAAVNPEAATTCGSPNYSVWYTITPATSATYRLETCTTTAPLDTVSDTVIAIYTGSCPGALTQLTGACNDDSCGFRSSLVFPLTAGTTYFVQVSSWGTTAPVVGSDVIQVSATLLAPPANDRCDGTVPSLALKTPMRFSTNGLTGDDAQVGGGNACFVGLGHAASTAPGRDVVFNFTPPATGAYNVRLGAASVFNNSVLYMTDSCVAAITPPQTYAPPQCLAASNRVGSSTISQEELVCVPLTGGTPYFIWADESVSSTSGANYEIEVTACLLETEANGTTGTASALACPITGSISPAGDVDFFQLGTNPAGSRVFAMVEAIAAGSGGASSNNFDLRVTTATDTLEFDDSDVDTLFGSLSGAVAGTPLPNAPSYLRVTHNTGLALEPYRLHSAIQPGVPTVESEPNDTTAQATAGGSNYFSGDVTSTTDVDMFAFGGRAGDLVFLALDSQPSRSGATATANHTLQLLNAAGTALVAVNDFATTVNNTLTTASLTAITPTVPSETLVYRIRTSGIYYARVGRTSATGTGLYALSISINCGIGGGIIGSPTLTSLTPGTGTVSGGTAVTLTGTNFSPSAVVTFGGVVASVVSRSATSLQVLSPLGSDGPVDVRVINPGELSAVLPGSFTYFTPILPPTVTSVTPTTGPVGGNTVITVSGTLFKAGAQVTLTVGGVTRPATNVVVVNSSQLRATTPAHAAGPATVTVRNPADALQGSLAAAFTYLAPPTLTSVTPTTGLTSGGQTVTLTGTAFRPGAVVRFGADPGSGVVVSSPTSLTVLTPSVLLAGVVDVTIVNTDTQQAVLTGAFTYTYPAPTILSVTPPEGYSAGGTTITITGTGFLPGAVVLINGMPAVPVTRISANQLTAVAPPGPAGAATVTVTNPDAQFATLVGGYTYVPPPTVTSISPTHGPVQGGTLVTLRGTGFIAGASVRIGGVPAFAVTVTSPTTATALTNSNAPGVADVVLVNPDLQLATLTAAYTYDPAPTLTSISPVSGTTTGGTVVRLTGTGFLTGASVLFGSGAATNVTVVSPTELTAATPMHAVGVVSVTVRNLDNQSAVLERAYRFVAPPTITAVAPDTSDVVGGTVVRVTGTGFTAATNVTFGGMAAAQVTLVSATQLDAVTAAHIPDLVDVQVSTDGAVATLAAAFTFTRGVPTLAAVAPPSGPVAGGTLLTLTGTGFAPGAFITIGGARATGVVIVSNVLARAVVPAHAAGVVDVVFTNDDAKAATLPRSFTFVAPNSNTEGTVPDGGDGSIGAGPTGGGGGAGGVSCGCSSFDGSMFSMAGFGLLMVLARRRRAGG